MTTKEFYDRHISLLAEGNPDALVDHDYRDDATMILLVTNEPQYVHGKEALKGMFKWYLENIYRGFISTEKLALSEDSIFLEGTIDTANGPAKVYDAIYLKDGQIYRHYSGLK
jgi:hypothetical protein